MIRGEKSVSDYLRTPESILVFESEPSLREGIALALVNAGFAVVTSPDYPKLLAMLDELNPNLIILGEGPSLVDRWEACSLLHRTRGIPIILLGREPSVEAWGRAEEAGFDYYFKKPFSYTELVVRAKAILRRYKKIAVAAEIPKEEAVPKERPPLKESVLTLCMKDPSFRKRVLYYLVRKLR